MTIPIEPFLGFIGGAGTAFLAWLGINRKSKTDDVALAMSAWQALLAPLQQELAEAKLEISALREALEIAEERHNKEREELVGRIKKLQTQLNAQSKT